MKHIIYQSRGRPNSLSHFTLWLVLALSVALFPSSTAWGQAPIVDWTVQVGSTEFDEALGILPHPSGLFVVGATAGPPAGQPSLGGGLDAFIGSYGFDGAEEWSRSFGTPGLDRAISVAADSSAIYIVGSTTGTFSGQSNTGNNLDAFVRKVNLRGFEVWNRQFGTLGSDEARSVGVGPARVYVSGTINADSAGHNTTAGADAFVRSYDFDGSLVWDQQFGTRGGDSASGLVVHPSGVYITGTVGGALSGQQLVGGDTDFFIRKYDFDGHEVWTRQWGTLGSDQVYGIATGSEGVFIVGSTTGAFTGLPNRGGGGDAFVVKYNFDGERIWTRQFGTEGSDEALAVAVSGGDVLVTGSTSGTFPGNSYAGGKSDNFLIKFNARGNRIWSVQPGTPASDQPSGIATHLDRVYLVGSTSGTFPSESDGFIASLALPEAVQPVPVSPTATPAPVPTATLTPMPSPTPTATPEPTLAPTRIPTSTPQPTIIALAVPTEIPTPRPTPTASSVPPTAPTATPWPTFPPLYLPPPEDSEPSFLQRMIILGGLGVIAVIAVIGILRNW